MNERKGRGGTAGWTILISALVLAVALPIVLSKVVPSYENTWLGWRILTVRGDSMEGVIRENAAVLVYTASWDSLEQGDIITFQTTGGTFVTHTIISRDGAHITTKGENVLVPDAGWVTRDNYKYKVVSIWNWVAWFSDHPAAVWLIGLPPAVIAFTAIAVLAARRIARRRRSAYEEYESAEDVISEEIAAEIAAAEARVDAEYTACLDELIAMLDPLLKQNKAGAAPRRKEKERPDERKASAAMDDDDDTIPWDEWAFRQLRRAEPPAGHAAS